MHYFKKVLFLVYLISMSSVVIGQTAEEELPAMNRKKILMTYGGWDGHQPDVFTERVAKWLRAEGAEVIISDSLGVYTDKKLMNSVDLIVQYWTMGQITKEQQQGLLEAVRNGTGIAGCHGGLGDSFRQNTDYQYMVGGQWVSHPGGRINYKVDIVNTDDPITKGLTDFEIKNTEQYYMHIDPNSEVLATTTFSNQHNDWIQGAVMPVSWKKRYGKGRVFYLSIGHDPKDFDTPSAWQLLSRGIRWASGSKHQATPSLVQPVYESHTLRYEWNSLLDKNLTQWDVFMGVPHKSVALKGYKKSKDVTQGVPIGLNTDPKNVFSVSEASGEPVLNISGEIYAGLVTKEEYENYHLSWKFRWGSKKWEPRLTQKRNSGILYHSVGQHTDFWKVWMTSLECEVQETDCGDFITIGKVKAKCPATKIEGKYYFDPKGELHEFCWGEDCDTGRCFKPEDYEKPIGEWNTMELLCVEGTSIHVLNGHVVMVVKDAKTNQSGVWKAMAKGKIQIQSEAAEVFYKDIKIRYITEFPGDYKIEAGL